MKNVIDIERKEEKKGKCLKQWTIDCHALYCVLFPASCRQYVFFCGVQCTPNAHNTAYMGERINYNRLGNDGSCDAITVDTFIKLHYPEIASRSKWNWNQITFAALYILCLAHKNLSRLSTQITFIFNSHFDGCNCAFDRLRLSFFVFISPIEKYFVFERIQGTVFLLWQATHA